MKATVAAHHGEAVVLRQNGRAVGLHGTQEHPGQPSAMLSLHARRSQRAASREAEPLHPGTSICTDAPNMKPGRSAIASCTFCMRIWTWPANVWETLLAVAAIVANCTWRRENGSRTAAVTHRMVDDRKGRTGRLGMRLGWQRC